jgi:hypothetical protein
MPPLLPVPRGESPFHPSPAIGCAASEEGAAGSLVEPRERSFTLRLLLPLDKLGVGVAQGEGALLLHSIAE